MPTDFEQEITNRLERLEGQLRAIQTVIAEQGTSDKRTVGASYAARVFGCQRRTVTRGGAGTWRIKWTRRQPRLMTTAREVHRAWREHTKAPKEKAAAHTGRPVKTPKR